MTVNWSANAGEMEMCVHVNADTVLDDGAC